MTQWAGGSGEAFRLSRLSFLCTESTIYRRAELLTADLSLPLLGRKALKFDTPPFELSRQDDAVTRERILSMTNAEARQAGISKTTLWHMNRDLAHNQRRKLYAKSIERLQVRP